MTMNPKEKDFLTKKELGGDGNNKKIIATTTIPSSSRQWSSTHRNPRIVRVSRAFGGKDRHSKVCTVRGLRDRRIRLSVPTAIQLYDLQDRLGLSQPSKVVDWLIEATMNDIDKLPPLPMLPTNFPQFHHQPITIDNQSSANNTTNQSSLSHFLASNYPFARLDKERDQENQENGIQEGFGGIFAQNLFPLTNINSQSSFANLPFNNSYNFHWDPASLSLSQFGGGYSFTTNQTAVDEENNNSNLSNNNSQLYFCPSAPNIIPSVIPNNFPNASYMMNNPTSSSLLMDNIHQNQLLPTALHLKNFPMNVGNDENERPGKNDRS
ncbi:hypothetical protein ACP275_04G147000 [Erythranthe tilingii]